MDSTFVWLKLYYLIYWVDCISCTQILTFWIIFSENQNDPAGCISGLKAEISQLEVLRYNLLRYLIRFLVVVAQFERSNKMSPMSLAIVFGPNLFRYLFISVTECKLLVQNSTVCYIICTQYAELADLWNNSLQYAGLG